VLSLKGWFLPRHLKRHYPLIIAHTGSCARPKPPRGLRFPYTAALCPPQADHQYLLGDGPSRCYLRESFPRCLDSYPGGTLWCACPFLSIELSAFPRTKEGQLLQCPVQRLQYGRFTRLQFRRRRIRAPGLITTQVAPTAVPQSKDWAAVTLTSEHPRFGTSPCPGYTIRLLRELRINFLGN